MQNIMNGSKYRQRSKRLYITGGTAGILSVSSYLLIAFLDLPDPVVFLFAMAFPIFGIVFLYTIKGYIDCRHPSHIANLSFIFGALAFTICAIMLSAQMAVQTGLNVSDHRNESDIKMLKESIRLIDLGIDVAWDVFIGSHLIALAFAARRVGELKWWGWMLGVLGTGLIILNTITFPNPPAESGYFDLGPFIAIIWLCLGAYILRLGIKMKV